MTPDPATIAAEPPRRPSPWRTIRRAIQVRSRFIVVMALAFLVVGEWETLRNRWDRAVRSILGGGRAEDQAVSSNTEYFCPMDPGVVSEWPGKCGACNMALVRRQKGEVGPLPSGVVARMQFSPYRLHLAGIRTVPAAYQPLTREVVLVGNVAGDHAPRVVEARAADRDLGLLADGQAAELTSDAEPGQPPLAARVRLVPGGDPRVELIADDPGGRLHQGMSISARVRCPVAAMEPFRSMPSAPPPIREGEPRTVHVCSDHPEVVSEGGGVCPIDGGTELEARPLRPDQRVGWWCPMHPAVTADRPGQTCARCGGMKLAPRVVTYAPKGQVLTIPESAVVDTGTRTVVYVERMEGMFDGVEVVLGPRCGDFYPVIRGLQPDDRVATSGAFLIDAETRLNPSLAASYFGAGSSTRRNDAPRAGNRAADDQALVASQRICPVTGKPLGSMGPPARVTVAGRSVMICCEGCEAALKKEPDKYLSRLLQAHD